MIILKLLNFKTFSMNFSLFQKTLSKVLHLDLFRVLIVTSLFEYAKKGRSPSNAKSTCRGPPARRGPKAKGPEGPTAEGAIFVTP